MSATDTSGTVPPRLHDLTASVKLVYMCLDVHGALTAQELRARTGVSKNTAWRSIGELQERDVVIERPDPEDGRRQRYVLAEHLQIPV
jgi:DNA-binding MarR family transcriptional regulator